MSSEQWTEHRALVRTPASHLATPAERRRGYVEQWTLPGRSQEDVRRDDWSLRRTEESLASVERWQTRVVTAGEWEG